MSARGPLLLTYDECRTRFRLAADAAGTAVAAHPIPTPGPDGRPLTIDVVHLGAARPARALTVLSGVHGVEGFAPSAMQAALLTRLADGPLPDDVAVVLVHAVNPWGMAWWRRPNESNVDLNRNWRRSEVDPVHNDAYDELHPIACPDQPDVPDVGDLWDRALALVEQRGLEWVRDGLTVGQYRHPTGLHYGGTRTEASNRILEQVVEHHLAGVERSLVLDLHTGHGPPAAVTFLSDEPPGTAQDRFLRSTFGAARVMATEGNPDATTAKKVGQIGAGFADLLAGAVHHASSVEFGTVSDEEQLVATYLEAWVHRHGDPADADHAAIRAAYRRCFTPDDPAWAAEVLDAGGRLLDDAVAAVGDWGR